MTPNFTRRAFALAACVAAATITVPTVHAQTGRPLTLVVPQPSGNPSDVFIRKLLPIMQRELGVTVVVENVPGAGGSIGMQRVLNAPADGAIAVVTSQTEPILTPFALSVAKYKPEQFRMVGTFGKAPYVLVARPGLTGTLAELLAQAKRPGAVPLNYGHIGSGSMIQLLGAQWSRQTGVPILHVAYKGVPPVLQDVMSSNIDLAFLPMGGMTSSLIDSGKIKVLGVSATQPVSSIPQVPTMQSQAPALKDFVYFAWGAVLVNRNTPEAAVERLNKAFNVAIQAPEVRAFLKSNGTDPAPPMSLAELERFYAAETKLYQDLARVIGVVAE